MPRLGTLRSRVRLAAARSMALSSRRARRWPAAPMVSRRPALLRAANVLVLVDGAAMTRDSGAIDGGARALSRAAASDGQVAPLGLASSSRMSSHHPPGRDQGRPQRVRRLRLGASYKDDPAWVPPLKDEVHGLLDPQEEPVVRPWPRGAMAGGARRARSSAGSARRSTTSCWSIWARHRPMGHVRSAGRRGRGGADRHRRGLASRQGMTRALGPITLSIWDEPGLLIEGFDQPPMVMMGHHRPAYGAWIEAAGYAKAKDLYTYELDIRIDMDPMIDRLIAAAKQPAHPHPQGRQVAVRRGGGDHPQPAQRRLVGQLGLRAADRGRDRLRRQETEADHLRGPRPHRRSRRRAGRLHDHHPRHQRVDRRPQRRLFPVRLGKIAVAAAQAAHQAGARAADGGGEEAPRHARSPASWPSC